MSNLRLSLAITFFATNGAMLVNFIVVIILSRLLSPSEIGVFSIAFVLVSIAHIFRDFGVSSYLVREKDLTPEKIRAVSGLLFTMSWSVAAALYLLSGTVATFYDEPGVENVVQVLAAGFIFIPFGAITHSLLTRELKAREQAIASILGMVVYATSSIALAMLGFSYMTMAWANLLNILATAIAFLPYRPSYAPWLPSFRGWGQVINFGTGALVGNAVRVINASIPDFALGRLSGPYDVGIMSRAISTTNLFTMIVGPTVNYAVLPVLSQKHHAGESLSEPMVKAIALLTGLAWPALLGTAIFAEQLIALLYGNKWLDCVPIVQIICVVALINTPLTFTSPALLAIGRPYLAAAPGALQLILTFAAIGLLYDKTLESFSVALLVASVFTFPLYLWLQQQYLGFGVGRFMSAQWKSLVISSILLSSMLAISYFAQALPGWAQLLVITFITIPLWVFLVLKFAHPIWGEIFLLGQRYPVLYKLFGRKLLQPESVINKSNK